MIRWEVKITTFRLLLVGFISPSFASNENSNCSPGSSGSPAKFESIEDGVFFELTNTHAPRDNHCARHEDNARVWGSQSVGTCPFYV